MTTRACRYRAAPSCCAVSLWPTSGECYAWSGNGQRRTRFHRRGKHFAHGTPNARQYPAHSINILADGRDCCVAAQDTLDLRTLRFSHGFTCRKKCCADAEQPLLVDRMHAHVRLVLRARSEVDSMCRRRSQSVRTSKTGTASTRSCVKSEYAQPLVIVSGTLFDTNIAYRRYTGTVPGE